MEFQPNTNLHVYSDRELTFINRHIQRFRLNDPKYKTGQLADYIRIYLSFTKNKRSLQPHPLAGDFFCDYCKLKAVKSAKFCGTYRIGAGSCQSDWWS